MILKILEVKNNLNMSWFFSLRIWISYMPQGFNVNWVGLDLIKIKQNYTPQGFNVD